ncbi:hypothetical protein [Desulfogranum mediterraneum]|uniref:hypothetical protein n=1 Tax=Desulfogranum mediterraneum TaxID=160661 RepID=UPI00041D36E5|nr:hypothetical protein [Desulfogranum mediterraneum]
MDIKSDSCTNPGDQIQGGSDEATAARCRRLRLMGLSVSILILWNGVCDYIYAYSPRLSGLEYFSPAVWEVIRTAGHRPHWLVLLAQTAGWLYPLYALSYYHWWIGMRRAGFWLASVPCGLLAYAILMIGGIQHAGWAFLSVLAQAKAAVGCTDQAFYAMADRFLLEHFILGDLTAILAFNVGAIWHAVGVASGRTMYPRWFVVVSPLGVLTGTMILGAFLPAPYAGVVIALFGTWFMLVPCLASTVWLWNRADDDWGRNPNGSGAAKRDSRLS